MKRLMILLVVLVLGNTCLAQHTLYPIFEGDLWGYINKTGKVVIKPQFRYALAFSEGLAAVRIEGRYGYIDTTGRVVIAPVWDIGNSFSHSLAQVFRDGKPLFIDKNGHEIFQHSFATIEPFKQYSVTIAATATGKYCLINRQGKMVTDTVFEDIERLGEAGFFGVNGLHDVTYPRNKNEVLKIERGIIDSNGHFVVSFGCYTNIKAFGRHYFRGTPVTDVATERRGITMILNEKGEKVMESAPGHYFELGKFAGFFDGLAKTSRCAEWKDKSGNWYFNYDRLYIEVLDERGKVRINDTMWNEMTPFCWGHAFARDIRTDKWALIDRNGSKVNDSLYVDVLYDGRSNSPEDLFGNGVAFAKTRSGWTGIDTNGNIVAKADAITNECCIWTKRVGDKVYLTDDISHEPRRYREMHGFWSAKNNVLLRPTYEWIDTHFSNGIVLAMKNHRYFYINDSGVVIWQGEEVNDSLGTLNVDQMTRGHYDIALKYGMGLRKDESWPISENCTPALDLKTKRANQLNVLLDESEETKWHGYNAIKLFVSNYSGDTLYFDEKNRWIKLLMQAQKENGEWADIEYLPSSWCGNSYHQVFLAPGQYWQFATPLYEGEIKTKLRAKLLYKKQPNQEVDDIVYSNEISGSVNPGQFWYKRKYTPAGMMDPYND